MKPKTIKSVLRRKTDAWLKSIGNETVRETAAKNSLVTGGAIASMLLGEKPNDFDIYFKNLEAAKAVAGYYVEQFKKNPPTRFKGSKQLVDIRVMVKNERVMVVVQSAGIAGESGSEDYQYFEQLAGDTESEQFIEDAVGDAQEAAEADTEKPKYRPVFLTSNAITLSDRIQLVTRFYGSADEIHENYDYVHCTCSWDADTGELTLPPAALESLLGKYLKYKRSKYPLCSIIRSRKFIERGWTIDAGQFVKMAWDLNQLDLSDMAVLEDQLVGVDAAYFYQVLALLREQDRSKIDGAYLMKVIDRVF